MSIHDSLSGWDLSDDAVLCPVNPIGHEWDGLGCRWCPATRTPAEAIVSGLASRRGGDRGSACALLEAYRAALLAEAKIEVVAWLVKKAREGTPVGELASKVDRGAVRIFLGTGHYRDAMDAHRAEVLNEAADFVGNDDECDCGGCDTCIPRKLADVLRAMAGEEATPTGATATPDFFQPGRSYLVDGHEFRCTHLDAHPVKGEPEAQGWFHRGDDRWQHRRFYDTEWARATPYTGEGS